MSNKEERDEARWNDLLSTLVEVRISQKVTETETINIRKSVDDVHSRLRNDTEKFSEITQRLAAIETTQDDHSQKFKQLDRDVRANRPQQSALERKDTELVSANADTEEIEVYKNRYGIQRLRVRKVSAILMALATLVSAVGGILVGVVVNMGAKTAADTELNKNINLQGNPNGSTPARK